MALIAICLSSLVGAFAGGIHIVLLGASFGQGVATYFVVSLVLTGINLTAAMFAKDSKIEDFQEIGSNDQWDNWHEEEDWRDAELEQAIEVRSTHSKAG